MPRTIEAEGYCMQSRIYPMIPKTNIIMRSNLEIFKEYVPITHRTATIGMSRPFGTSIILVTGLAIRTPTTHSITEPRMRRIAISYVNVGLVEVSIGPGRIPCSCSALSITAAGGLPGSARHSIGINAPPIAALFAVSGAITPS